MTLFLEVLEDGWINWIKIQNPEREAMNIYFVGSGFCICEIYFQIYYIIQLQFQVSP